MRIFLITNGYPSNKYLGNGIFEFDQAKALAARGHDVIYLAIDLRSIRRWRHWGRESLKKDSVNIEAINIPLGRVPQKILHSFGKSGLSSVFKQCVKKYGKPDIIHAHFTDSAYLAVKALNKYDIPIVMTEHSSAINKENIDPLDRKVAQYVYKNVDKIFAVSPALKKRIKDTFQADSTYIPNIVDLNIFSRKLKINNDDRFLIVTVGNLIPLKRMDRLLAGFSKFLQKHQNSELIVLGDGPERIRLQKLATELNLDDKVIFKGMCTRMEISGVLEDTSCFILISSSETFGVAYIEALACGVPVIATTCGGPEGFVHEGNGILIPVDDEKALLEAMNTMYDKASTYDREKIAAEIREKFSPERVAVQLEDMYKFELRNIR
jgi:glycosyltransferase involved in cell wall biosynthesis